MNNLDFIFLYIFIVNLLYVVTKPREVFRAICPYRVSMIANVGRRHCYYYITTIVGIKKLHLYTLLQDFR